jgi:hypothetical protein
MKLNNVVYQSRGRYIERSSSERATQWIKQISWAPRVKRHGENQTRPAQLIDRGLQPRSRVQRITVSLTVHFCVVLLWFKNEWSNMERKQCAKRRNLTFMPFVCVRMRDRKVGCSHFVWLQNCSKLPVVVKQRVEQVVWLSAKWDVDWGTSFFACYEGSSSGIMLQRNEHLKLQIQQIHQQTQKQELITNWKITQIRINWIY